MGGCGRCGSSRQWEPTRTGQHSPPPRAPPAGVKSLQIKNSAASLHQSEQWAGLVQHREWYNLSPQSLLTDIETVCPQTKEGRSNTILQ